MQDYLKKRSEEFDKGSWTEIAPIRWNDDNVKGYLECKKDVKPFINQTIIGLLELEIERIKDGEWECDEECYCDGHPPCEFEMGYNQANQDQISYYQEQIKALKV